MPTSTPTTSWSRCRWIRDEPELEGRAAVRERFAAAASGPLELRAHHIIVHATTDPEVVIAEFQYDGLNRTTGITFTVANVQVLRVRDGHIVASRDYHDHAGFAASRGR